MKQKELDKLYWIRKAQLKKQEEAAKRDRERIRQLMIAEINAYYIGYADLDSLSYEELALMCHNNLPIEEMEE